MADRFDAHADELGALVTKENGKILAQGMFESPGAALACLLPQKYGLLNP
jgi:acyl-CoA reductase-like NAD-dependent aldehyde dehydrogenase